MKYLILLLPLVYGKVTHDGITISIIPAQSKDNTTVTYNQRTDIKPVTISDIEVFNLTQANLEKYIEKYSGAKAAKIFTKRPKSSNNTKWRELKRRFKVKEITKMDVLNVEKVLADKKYDNNGSENKTIKASVLDACETFKSRHVWSGNDNISARVRYELTRPYDPPLHYGYISEVGADDFGSGINIISYKDSGVNFTLNPGQKAKYLVTATKVKVKVEVTYETNLQGDIGVKYAKKHKGKIFWFYHINEVLTANNITNKVTTYEDVEIEYLTDYRSEVIDTATGKYIKFDKKYKNDL